MMVSDGALREGLLYNQLKRFQNEDVRGGSIKNLATLYRVDEQQSERVSNTALFLWDNVAPTWGLEDPAWRDLLAWSAQVCEIGLAIAHSQHQKHAGYILENADLAGFSRQEQRQLAILVRSHRRKFSMSLFKGLDNSVSKSLQRLAIILRLSTLLHRSRSDETLPPIKVSAHKKNITLEFPQAWLEEHSLTLADLEQESEFLTALSFTLTII
jgi:exopolyphosphatase/guanosine-5'-triphosphate,3'-diphosphate pyrophosphatase